MKDKLDMQIKRAFKKPMFRIAMIILGLPTFIVASICFLFTKNQEKKMQQQFRQDALENMKRDGTLEKIRTESELYIRNKYNYFNKKTENSEFGKEMEKQIGLDVEKEIARRVEESYAKEQKAGNRSFADFLCNSLNKPLLLTLSIISSFPMYVLILIFSNVYSRYIFQRLIMMIFVAFGVVFVVFTILHFASSSPAANVLGETATKAQVDAFNKTYGLDQPYIVQLLTNFKKLATFNMGNSFSGNEDVMLAIMRRFPVTLLLTVYAFILGIVVSIPLGIISAIKANSAYDYVFMFIALVGLSIPAFWFGMILILNFSINTHLLPSSYTVGSNISLLMPAIVMGTGLAASLARNTRSALLEVLNEDYIVTAKAKGLSNFRVIVKHALGNAMIPIVTIAGLQFGAMLGGSAVIEKVFNIKGIGQYIIDKQFLPDIPAILAGVVYVSVVISVVNLLVDLLYVYLDPRIKARLKNQ